MEAVNGEKNWYCIKNVLGKSYDLIARRLITYIFENLVLIRSYS